MTTLRVTQLNPIKIPESVSADPRFLPHQRCLQCRLAGVFASTQLCQGCHLVWRATGHPPDSFDERRMVRDLRDVCVLPDADDWLVVCRGTSIDPAMVGYFVDALIVPLAGACYDYCPPWTLKLLGSDGLYLVLRYRFWKPGASSYLMVWMDPAKGERREWRDVASSPTGDTQTLSTSSLVRVGRGRPKAPRYLDATHFQVAFEAAYRTCAERLVTKRPLLSQVATELRMSSRTLSRELEKYGFRYRDLSRLIDNF